MGAINFLKPLVHINPKPTEDTEVSVGFHHKLLFENGLNILVEISTASIFLEAEPEKIPKAATVLAHFDTGASSTSIDISLAKAMGLETTGISNIRTAAGEIPMPVFTVNIGFPNAKLSPFIDLEISSCNLNYEVGKPLSPSNFGILLGRDIMSRWNIVWNGPTSTVFISD